MDNKLFLLTYQVLGMLLHLNIQLPPWRPRKLWMASGQSKRWQSSKDMKLAAIHVCQATFKFWQVFEYKVRVKSFWSWSWTLLCCTYAFAAAAAATLLCSTLAATAAARTAAAFAALRLSLFSWPFTGTTCGAARHISKYSQILTCCCWVDHGQRCGHIERLASGTINPPRTQGLFSDYYVKANLFQDFHYVFDVVHFILCIQGDRGDLGER